MVGTAAIEVLSKEVCNNVAAHKYCIITIAYRLFVHISVWIFDVLRMRLPMRYHRKDAK